jgi:hypothetical protein
MYKPLTETNLYYAGIIANMGLGVYLNPPNNATEAELEGSRDAAKAIHNAWCFGVITTEELAREHLRLIADDVDAGYVPWDVWDFSELHNYTDANCYSLEVCGLYIDETDDPALDLINACQARVSEMLCGTTQPGYHEWREENRVLAGDRKYEYHRDRNHSLNSYIRAMGKDVNAE